jgi:hypothetical protein
VHADANSVRVGMARAGQHQSKGGGHSSGPESDEAPGIPRARIAAIIRPLVASTGAESPGGQGKDGQID